MKISDDLIEALNNSKVVSVFVHVKPDGDCIGAGMAVKLILEKMGKKVDIFCDGDIPKSFGYLKDIQAFNHPKYEKYDTAIAVDVPTSNRIGCYAELYKKAECRVNIDHHKTNDLFGNINLVDGTRASACEIVFELAKVLGVAIDKSIAEALFTGVSTDTGSFMHANTTPVTHIIAAELMKAGADTSLVNEMVYKSKSLGQVALKRIALNNMQLFCANKVCIGYITKRDYIDNNCSTNDSTGIVDNFIGIEGVEIGALISEDKPGICAVSIRSKGKIDVSLLGAYFGGGGHTNAAGCNIFGTAKTALNKLVKAIKEVYAGIY